MDIVLENYLNSICCDEIVAPFNEFTYTTGTAPSLEDFENAIGFSLINGQKVGDTITFDNVGYTINNSFFGTTIKNVTTSATIVGNNVFRGCSVLESFIGNNITDTGTGFLSNNPSLTNVSYDSIINMGREFLANSPNINNFNFTNVNNFGALEEISPGIVTSAGTSNSFLNITGKTITLTAKSIHQTSNGGNLEGDLQYLADNNTVTFIWV